jgi:hypothetical protein
MIHLVDLDIEIDQASVHLGAGEMTPTKFLIVAEPSAPDGQRAGSPAINPAVIKLTTVRNRRLAEWFMACVRTCKEGSQTTVAEIQRMAGILHLDCKQGLQLVDPIDPWKGCKC